MKISILMPTYRCPPDLLAKSIESVISQNFTDWEIIIKDGDTENPDAKVLKIINLFHRNIHYYNSPENSDRANNQNSVYEAINFCIQHSTGEILSLLCGDDERGDSGVLQTVHDEFTTHGPGPFCLYGACEWIDRDSNHIEIKQPIPDVKFESMLTDYRFYTPAIFWNRAVHDKFGLFDADQYRWCADQDFWLRCWRGIDSKCSTAVLGKYRVWETSLARKNCEILGAEGQEIIRRHS